MAAAQNKAILRRFWEEVFNGKNQNLIDELFTTDWAYHGAGGQELRGPEALLEIELLRKEAFGEPSQMMEKELVAV